MIANIRFSLSLLSAFALVSAATVAGTVLVPPASVTGSSSSFMFSATNNSSGPAIQALSVGGMALNASTRAPSGLALKAFNSSTTGGSAILAGSFGNTIQSTSQHGNGIVGVTRLTGTASFGAAGVYGLDGSSSQYDSGVEGVSKAGYGVVGHTHLKGCEPGGIDGLGGVAGFADGVSTGILGLSSGTGYTCAQYPPYGTGVSGDGNIGVLGSGVDHLNFERSSPGVGLYGTGSIGAEIVGTGVGNVGAFIPSSALRIEQQGNTPVILAYGNGPAIMSLDINGNMILSGTLTQNGTPQTNAVAKSSSTSVSSQGRATKENVGESRLTSGQAFVRLNAAWAHDVDLSQPYEVFITPNGPSGLIYVADRSSVGFAVRENSGGHSNVPFSYRIVGKMIQPAAAHNANVKLVKNPVTTMANQIIAKMRLGVQHYGNRQIPKLQ